MVFKSIIKGRPISTSRSRKHVPTGAGKSDLLAKPFIPLGTQSPSDVIERFGYPPEGGKAEISMDEIDFHTPDDFSQQQPLKLTVRNQMSNDIDKVQLDGYQPSRTQPMPMPMIQPPSTSSGLDRKKLPQQAPQSEKIVMQTKKETASFTKCEQLKSGMKQLWDEVLDIKKELETIQHDMDTLTKRKEERHNLCERLMDEIEDIAKQIEMLQQQDPSISQAPLSMSATPLSPKVSTHSTSSSSQLSQQLQQQQHPPQQQKQHQHQHQQQKQQQMLQQQQDIQQQLQQQLKKRQMQQLKQREIQQQQMEKIQKLQQHRDRQLRQYQRRQQQEQTSPDSNVARSYPSVTPILHQSRSTGSVSSSPKHPMSWQQPYPPDGRESVSPVDEYEDSDEHSRDEYYYDSMERDRFRKVAGPPRGYSMDDHYYSDENADPDEQADDFYVPRRRRGCSCRSRTSHDARAHHHHYDHMHWHDHDEDSWRYYPEDRRQPRPSSQFYQRRYSSPGHDAMLQRSRSLDHSVMDPFSLASR